MKRLLDFSRVALSVARVTLGVAALTLAWQTAGWQTICSAAGPVAIKAGKLIPIVGEPIENAVILINDGKIVEIGTDVEIPVEAKVIDASNSVVMPGFIDPHSPSGMSQANERNTNVPFLSAVDSIDPVLDYFEDSRRNGVTTTAIFPGNSTMIGGRGVVMKTAGAYINDMLLVREAGLKISLSPVGGSRMSHLARLRRELDKTKRGMEDGEAAEASVEQKSPSDGDAEKDADKPAGDEPEGEADSDENSSATEDEKASEEETTVGVDVMRRLLKGELRAFIYCQSAMDVGQAKKLMNDYGIKGTLILGRDCYKAAKEVAGEDQLVILDPSLVYWETNPKDRSDKKIIIPKLMMDAGVKFVVQADDSGTRQTLGSGFLWYQAATCVKYGMAEADALRGLTLTTAEMLGVSDFIGSIEVGKDADLVILSGDPLSSDTWVEKTIVAGDVVYEREKDQKLKRLLEEPAE